MWRLNSTILRFDYSFHTLNTQTSRARKWHQPQPKCWWKYASGIQDLLHSPDKKTMVIYWEAAKFWTFTSCLAGRQKMCILQCQIVLLVPYKAPCQAFSFKCKMTRTLKFESARCVCVRVTDNKDSMTDMWPKGKFKYWLQLLLVLLPPSAATCTGGNTVTYTDTLPEMDLHSPSFTEPPNSDPLSKASFHVKVKQSCGDRETLCVQVLLSGK